MPEGRFVSRKIAHNTALASVPLEADFLFTRCIPHLDRDGRMVGHPELVKAIVCPLRPEITTGSIPDLIRSLAGVGLLRWYSIDGVSILEFPGFSKNNRLPHYDREAPSRFGPSTYTTAQDLVRSESGPDPDEVHLKLKEGKGREEEVKTVLRTDESKPKNPYRDTAVHLRNLNVEESHIGDTIKNWLPGATKMFGEDVVWAVLDHIGARQKSPWNPAAMMNLRNADGRDRFVFHAGNAMKGPKRVR
jgi:hypothetical protein